MNPLQTDRWIEIDLYWFDHANIAQSCVEFWDRYQPLFFGIEGWKGVIINVGWIMDFVLDWRGDLDALIPLVRNMHLQQFVKDNAPLHGTLATRQQNWKRRFTSHGEVEASYPNWTYRDLGHLIQVLREEAARRGLEDIRVGTMVLGWDGIYEGKLSDWKQRHPHAFIKCEGFFYQVFNVEAILEADPTTYGAFPRGIQQPTPITEFFGKQWGDLSQALGLEAIILRDSMIGPLPYTRRGPYGNSAPADPAIWQRWSQSTADLIRQCKKANPEALVIGYSSAASAVGEWRVNCVDLEAIAHEGYLDAWIDQTWAGAWNEVGVRSDTFWNCQWLGYTYQLTYLLLHAAILAKTKVRHYVLTETFDGWESWDTIHTAPERLRWAIWAYHHAAVLLPKGLKMPAGTYISWGNQAKDLLTPADVYFLAQNLNEAIESAQKTTKVHGPTLVYSRPSMEWMSQHAPHQTIKEWLDEQAGSVMKWSVPIASVARVEDLGELDLDLPILQTPIHLSEICRQLILERIASGKPTAIFASPAGGIDYEIAKAAGLQSQQTFPGGTESLATLHLSPFGADIPSLFPLNHLFSNNLASQEAQILYSVAGSPALILRGNTLVWDPPDWDGLYPPDINWINGVDLSLREHLGSVYPYVLVARALNHLLPNNSLATRPEHIHPEFPVGYVSWQHQDGSRYMLVGQLEEGIPEHTDMDVSLCVQLSSREATQAQSLWLEKAVGIEEGSLMVKLKYAQSDLISINKQR